MHCLDELDRVICLFSGSQLMYFERVTSLLDQADHFTSSLVFVHVQHQLCTCSDVVNIDMTQGILIKGNGCINKLLRLMNMCASVSVMCKLTSVLCMSSLCIAYMCMTSCSV